MHQQADANCTRAKIEQILLLKVSIPKNIRVHTYRSLQSLVDIVGSLALFVNRSVELEGVKED